MQICLGRSQCASDLRRRFEGEREERQKLGTHAWEGALSASVRASDELVASDHCAATVHRLKEWNRRPNRQPLGTPLWRRRWRCRSTRPNRWREPATWMRLSGCCTDCHPPHVSEVATGQSGKAIWLLLSFGAFLIFLQQSLWCMKRWCFSSS